MTFKNGSHIAFGEPTHMAAKRNKGRSAKKPVPSQPVVRWLNIGSLRPGRFGMEDPEIRAALDRHWAASDADDFETEHEIYREDAVLEYPQSGERIRGRRNIQASRTVQPNRKRFAVRRIVGAGDLWVTEYVLSYDGRPSYTVSIMEFREGKVARETQYFGDPFEPGASRAHLVERMA
jgi:SnoaL-like domain